MIRLLIKTREMTGPKNRVDPATIEYENRG